MYQNVENGLRIINNLILIKTPLLRLFQDGYLFLYDVCSMFHITVVFCYLICFFYSERNDFSHDSTYLDH